MVRGTIQAHSAIYLLDEKIYVNGKNTVNVPSKLYADHNVVSSRRRVEETWKGEGEIYRPVEVAAALALSSLTVCRSERLCAPGTPAGALGIYRLSSSANSTSNDRCQC